MTIEYAIITILAIALLFQTWHKRTWKRRATAHQLGLWGVFKQSFTESVQKRSEWPELIDEKK
jgi:hypothetical protein